MENFFLLHVCVHYLHEESQSVFLIEFVKLGLHCMGKDQSITVGRGLFPQLKRKNSSFQAFIFPILSSAIIDLK